MLRFMKFSFSLRMRTENENLHNIVTMTNWQHDVSQLTVYIASYTIDYLILKQMDNAKMSIPKLPKIIIDEKMVLFRIMTS